jgi:hypothetical protein
MQSRGRLHDLADFARLQGESSILKLLLHVTFAEEAADYG